MKRYDRNTSVDGRLRNQIKGDVASRMTVQRCFYIRTHVYAIVLFSPLRDDPCIILESPMAFCIVIGLCKFCIFEIAIPVS